MTFEEKKHIIVTIFQDNEISIQSNRNVYDMGQGGSLHSDFIHPLIQCRIYTGESRNTLLNIWFYKFNDVDLDNNIEELSTIYSKHEWNKLLPIAKKLHRNNKLNELLH